MLSNLLKITQPIGDGDGTYTQPLWCQNETMLVKCSAQQLCAKGDLFTPGSPHATFSPVPWGSYQPYTTLCSNHVMFVAEESGREIHKNNLGNVSFLLKLITTQMTASRKNHFPGTFPNLLSSKEKKINLSPWAKLEHLQTTLRM